MSKTPAWLLNGNPNCRCVVPDNGLTWNTTVWPDPIQTRDSRIETFTYMINRDLVRESYAYEGQRFGRVVKEITHLGELRRQKKAPHKEVFYTWVLDPEHLIKVASGTNLGKPPMMVLRSVNNCSSDQLTESIRRCGNLIEGHHVSREDGELVLDLLYAELGKRLPTNAQSS